VLKTFNTSIQVLWCEIIGFNFKGSRNLIVVGDSVTWCP